MIGIIWIHPHIVKIAVCGSADNAETFATVLAHDQSEVWLVHFVFVLWVHDKICEVERPPDHPVAAIALFPGFSAVAGLPNAAAGRADIHCEPPVFFNCSNGGDTPAHGSRSDISSAQT